MNKEPIKTPVILVTGSKMMQYWGDKLFARLLNWKMLNGCGKHMSDTEFIYSGQQKKAIVIVFGSVNVNDVAKEICLIYPEPIYSGTTFWGGYYYMHCGAIKDNEKYKIIDPCILLAGKTLLGTLRAVWTVVFGKWKTICKELIETDWDSLAPTEESKWRTKFWYKNEKDVEAEKISKWSRTSARKRGKTRQQINQPKLLPGASGYPYTYPSNTPVDPTKHQNDRDAQRELENAHNIIRDLKAKVANNGKIPNRNDLIDKVETCRFNNGSINFSKLGKKLGVSYKTAQSYCKRYHIE